MTPITSDMAKEEYLSRIGREIKDLARLIKNLLKGRIQDYIKYLKKSTKKQEIIKLIQNGVTRQSEIARILNVDRTTIRDHINAINKKAMEFFGLPLVRTSRSKGLIPTILFEFVLDELKVPEDILSLEEILEEPKDVNSM